MLYPGSDMWSCGILLFQLLTGRLPFDKPILEELKKGLVYFSQEEDEEIPANARDLVNKLLVFNPDSRLTAKEALDHPFFHEPGDVLPLFLSNELEQYVSLSNLRNSVEFLMIFETLKEEEAVVMEKMFQSIDVSADGYISKEEFDEFIDCTETNSELVKFLKEQVYPELDS